MKVANKTMYHIHNSNEYDDLWQVNNELMVDNNFLSKCGRAIPEFNTIIYGNNGEVGSLSWALKYYLEQGIENQDPKLIQKLLEEAFMIISNVNRTKCEAALEICRRQQFPMLPSRLHSIWVTDKDGLDFWLQQLSGREIFELDLTGELFKSSDIFIPDDNLTLEEAVRQSENYWDPVFTPEAEERKEYLFQGKVLVKKKLL